MTNLLPPFAFDPPPVPILNCTASPAGVPNPPASPNEPGAGDCAGKPLLNPSGAGGAPPKPKAAGAGAATPKPPPKPPVGAAPNGGAEPNGALGAGVVEPNDGAAGVDPNEGCGAAAPKAPGAVVDETPNVGADVVGAAPNIDAEAGVELNAVGAGAGPAPKEKVEEEDGADPNGLALEGTVTGAAVPNEGTSV